MSGMGWLNLLVAVLPGIGRKVKGFKDSLSRQVSESVRIDMRKGVLNNKAVYSRNKLPRLEIQRTEWEREDEERRALLLD